MAKKDYYFMQPKYYKDFHCIGGECTYSCCAGGWRINWKKEYVEKLKADCSPEILEIAEKSFKLNEENDKEYLIDMTLKNGDCPFWTEDKMCMIQRELGYEYLSDTCALYPRHFAHDESRANYYLSTTCPEVFRLITENEDSMDLISGKTKIKDREYTINSYNKQTRAKKPELEYYAMITEFFYELIYRNSRAGDLDSAVVQTVAMAESLQKLIDHKTYDKIPEWIHELKEQSNQLFTINVSNDKDRSYASKCEIMARIFKYFSSVSSLRNLVNEKGFIIIGKYAEAKEKFDGYEKDHPYVIRNLALNVLLETFSMGIKSEPTLFERTCYFATVVSLIRFIGAGCMEIEGDFDKSFRDAVISTSRSFTTAKFMEHIIAVLKETNTLSLSGIALLMKF